MRHALAFGILLAFSAPALAQSSVNTTADVPISADNFDALKAHLKSGAEIYDPKGKIVGSFAGGNPTDGYLVHETSMMGGSSILRILPAGALGWSNGKLITNIMEKDFHKLPAA